MARCLPAEEEGNELFAVGPRNRLIEGRWERRSRNHDIASVRKQVLAGRPKVHMLVVRVERECLIGREVDTLAESDRLPECVQFDAEDEHVRVRSPQ
jgi:hypothetical protein